MSAPSGWTPPPRTGIVPLHPLTFATILGRSFVALRHNPRVLLGFALGAQLVVGIVSLALLFGLGLASFSRLETVPPGSDDYDTILIGSGALMIGVALVVSLASAALTIIVQAIVIADVSHGALAEKRTLAELWRHVRPSFWRLLGYTFLAVAAVIAVMLVLTFGIVGLSFLSPPLAIAFTIIIIFAAIPLVLWLATKLMVVPAVIVIEGARVFPAIRRAWVLIRGRFWAALGILVLIYIIFAVLSQIVTTPLTFLGMGVTSVFAPTGDLDVTSVVTFMITTALAQVLSLLVGAIALVVQSTAIGLVYLDIRMRREALDLDLLTYVERRDAGEASLANPYLASIGRVAAPPAPSIPAYSPPPGYAPPPTVATVPAGQPEPAAPQSPLDPPPESDTRPPGPVPPQ